MNNSAFSGFIGVSPNKLLVLWKRHHLWIWFALLDTFLNCFAQTICIDTNILGVNCPKW